MSGQSIKIFAGKIVKLHLKTNLSIEDCIQRFCPCIKEQDEGQLRLTILEHLKEPVKLETNFDTRVTINKNHRVIRSTRGLS